MFAARQQHIVQCEPSTISDGIMIASTAALSIDYSRLSSHDYLIIMRAIERGIIKAVSYRLEDLHEDVSVC